MGDKCQACRGSGKLDDGICPVCNGQGKIQAMVDNNQTMDITCPMCQGNRRKQKDCTWCGGTGIRR